MSQLEVTARPVLIPSYQTKLQKCKLILPKFFFFWLRKVSELLKKIKNEPKIGQSLEDGACNCFFQHWTRLRKISAC